MDGRLGSVFAPPMSHGGERRSGAPTLPGAKGASRYRRDRNGPIRLRRRAARSERTKSNGVDPMRAATTLTIDQLATVVASHPSSEPILPSTLDIALSTRIVHDRFPLILSRASGCPRGLAPTKPGNIPPPHVVHNGFAAASASLGKAFGDGGNTLDPTPRPTILVEASSRGNVRSGSTRVAS